MSTFKRCAICFRRTWAKGPICKDCRDAADRWEATQADGEKR